MGFLASNQVIDAASQFSTTPPRGCILHQISWKAGGLHFNSSRALGNLWRPHYRAAKGSTQDHIESDSKDAIELIKKGRIIREGNNFADTLAKLGTDQSVRLVELVDPPAAITGTIKADLITIGSLWM
ncbi:hypothetical protein RHSIM_Rhsim07G0043500 [Rhododendron simsii]|uniref:Uncharacterized protein n=1 Tax=Rhododendron simsii TaxID=118357 RepID=A0A834GPH3_RHOSS|nr:hypothetical protein RHSIM_Rhsim07G0043500 [Rhododendron simsii]